MSEPAYHRYAAEHEAHFLAFKAKGLDGSKVSILEAHTRLEDLAKAEKGLESQKSMAKDPKELKEIDVKIKEAEQDRKDAAKELQETLERTRLNSWWAEAQQHAAQDAPAVGEANLEGGRMALKLTAAVPAAMAVLYLLLIVYFKMRGGYKRVEIAPTAPAADPNVEPAPVPAGDLATAGKSRQDRFKTLK
jgi:hypothetical protein